MKNTKTHTKPKFRPTKHISDNRKTLSKPYKTASTSNFTPKHKKLQTRNLPVRQKIKLKRRINTVGPIPYMVPKKNPLIDYDSDSDEIITSAHPLFGNFQNELHTSGPSTSGIQNYSRRAVTDTQKYTSNTDKCAGKVQNTKNTDTGLEPATKSPQATPPTKLVHDSLPAHLVNSDPIDAPGRTTDDRSIEPIVISDTESEPAPAVPVVLAVASPNPIHTEPPNDTVVIPDDDSNVADGTSEAPISDPIVISDSESEPVTSAVPPAIPMDTGKTQGNIAADGAPDDTTPAPIIVSDSQPEAPIVLTVSSDSESDPAPPTSAAPSAAPTHNTNTINSCEHPTGTFISASQIDPPVHPVTVSQLVTVARREVDFEVPVACSQPELYPGTKELRDGKAVSITIYFNSGPSEGHCEPCALVSDMSPLILTRHIS